MILRLLHTRVSRWLPIGCILLPIVAAGHSPHHVITDIATATVSESKSHTFILITDQVFRSDERGAEWKNLVNGLNNRYAFTDIEMSGQYESDGIVFLASSGDGVYRSSTYGESWKDADAGLGRLDIGHLSISSNFAYDNRVLAAAISGGVWRSLDGGDTWHLVLSENVKIGSFAEVGGEQDKNVIVAGDDDGNIWRSDDNGKLWEIIFSVPDAGAITSIAVAGADLLAGTERAGLHRITEDGKASKRLRLPAPEGQLECRDADQASVPAAHITSVTIEPYLESENRTFVTTWYGGVYVSDDGGSSWKTWQTGLSCDSQANRMSSAHFNAVNVAHFDGGEKVYWLGAFDGLFRSTAPFTPWAQMETLPLGLIKGMAVTGSENRPTEIALSTYGGGFYLFDTGIENWVIGNKGLITTRLTGLGFSPDFANDGTIYAGASRRLLRSTDHGRSWHPIELDRPGFGRRVVNKLNSLGVPTGWLSSSDGHGRGPVYPTQLVALPGDRAGRVLIATRYHGLIAYDAMDDSIEPLWSDTSRVMYSLVISPDFVRDQTIFSSIRGEGLFRSADGGKSWHEINSGLDFVENWKENRRRGDFRRDVHIAISPSYAEDGVIFSGSPAGDGLYVSEDHGSSWRRVNADFGLSPAPILAVAVSPEFESDHSLLVSVKGSGLFRSEDGGKSFESTGGELIGRNASIEYLEYSPVFGSDKKVIAASDEHLFVSADHGSSWRKVPRPVRYEDMRDVVYFAGDWQRSSGSKFSASTETATSSRNGHVTVRFVGTGIRWIGSRGPQYGSADVYIDEELVGSVSCKADSPQFLSEIFTIDGLNFGPHIVEVRANPDKTASSLGKVAVDAFDVLP